MNTIRTRWLLLHALLLPTTGCVTKESGVNPTPLSVRAIPTGTESGETDVLLKDVGLFTLGAREYLVRPSVSNSESPSRWNFAYEPLLQPVRTQASGGGPVEVSIDGKDVSFGLAIWNVDAQKRALATIKKFYGAQADAVPESNVRAMRVSSIKLTCPELAELDDKAKMVPDPIYFGVGGVAETIRITIRASDEQRARAIALRIPKSYWNAETQLFARVAVSAKVTFEGSQALVASFRVELDGSGTKKDPNGHMYVHRSDLRKFLAKNEDQIIVSAQIEKGSLASPEEFVSTIIDKFMKRWDTLVKKDYEAGVKESTFHANDLTPTQVTKTLDHIITKGSREDVFKVNVKGGVSGGVSIGPISAQGAVNGEYGKEEIAKWLQENDVTAEWNGTRWEAKAVQVRQVNDGAFDVLSKAVITLTQVSPPQLSTTQTTLDFGTPTKDGVESLHGRVGLIESQFTALSSELATLKDAARNPRTLSTSGTIAHGGTIPVPFGSTDDWSVLVSPKTSGYKEGANEHDNALMAVECFVSAKSDKTGWIVAIRDNWRESVNKGDFGWAGREANFIVVRNK